MSTPAPPRERRTPVEGEGHLSPAPPKVRGIPQTAGLLWLRLQDLLSALYPEPRPSRLPRRWIVPGYIGAFLAITSVSLLRQSGLSPLKSIWAEDGPVFLSQAVNHSFGWTLVHTYAGYIQLWPRLVAELATLLPLRYAAATLSASGAFALAAISLTVFHSARAYIRSPALRVLLVTSMVLLPIAASELLNNAVNLIWWLLFAAFWMLLWRPKTMAGALLAGLICFLATASELLVLIFLPLLLLRVIKLRSFRDHVSTIGFLVGTLYQGSMILLNGGGVASQTATFQGVAQAFALHVGLGWLTGSQLSTNIINFSLLLATVLGTVLFVLVVAVSLVQRDKELRAFAALALAYSVIAFVAPVWVRGAGLDMINSVITNGGRYAATPMLLIVACLLMSADRFMRRAPARHSSWPTGVRLVIPILCCAILAPFWVVDFHDTNLRSTGITWTSQVAYAHVNFCPSSPGSFYDFQTSPPGWGIAISCRFIDEH